MSSDSEARRIADEAMDRARKSGFVLVRVSERRYALVQLTSASARGIVGKKEMFGVRTGRVIKPYHNMKIEEAYELMRKIDLEGYDPLWEQA